MRYEKAFRHSSGLIPLGKIESGFNELKDIDKTLNIKVEKIN